MPPKLHVFISYKKQDNVTPAYATNIAETLQTQYGISCFIDKLKIDTADQWEEKIYSEIRHADVLILLLEPQTAFSEWVQREVDFARGACVSLLPLLMVDKNKVDIAEAVKKLAISSLQHSEQFHQTAKDYDRLVANIRRLALDTRDAQRRQHRQRERHWYGLPSELKLKASSYRISKDEFPDLNIHIAVGNILDMLPDTLDVIVNSENDHLQMARFYEINTLSARLRKAGAHFKKGRMLEDTLQIDLDACASERPVALTQVLVTPAGHPDSDLRARKHLKLIFHAITVQFDVGDLREPVRALTNDEAIHDTIRHCIEIVNEVNRNSLMKDTVSPTDTSIKNIAFPMFGTGMGGRSIREVAPAMVTGLKKAILSENPSMLRNVYLLVYSPNELTWVEAAMGEAFKKIDL